jgi:hypothetical protein
VPPDNKVLLVNKDQQDFKGLLVSKVIKALPGYKVLLVSKG